MKIFLKKIFDEITCDFGFLNATDYFNSLIHKKLLFLTLPTSVLTSWLVITGFIERTWGLTFDMFLGFMVIAGLELFSGLFASKVIGHKFDSRKFGRFGFKFIVWLSLIAVVYSFKKGYELQHGIQNTINYQFYAWFHGATIIYVSIEYILSIVENLAKITGQTNILFVSTIRSKVNGIIGTNKADSFFEDNDTLLAIIGEGLIIFKLDPTWENTMGYSLSEMYNTSIFNFVHPDNIEELKIKIEESKSKNKEIQTTFNFLKKDGSYVEMCWNFKPDTTKRKLNCVARII